MFFHDVLNAAGGLRDVLQLWPALDREEAADMGARLAPLAAQVVEEIESQRDLAACLAQLGFQVFVGSSPSKG